MAQTRAQTRAKTRAKTRANTRAKTRAPASLFHHLDVLCCERLVGLLGSKDTVRLLQADPTLAPFFTYSLERQRLAEMQLAVRAELEEAMSTWPHLLNGFPGADPPQSFGPVPGSPVPGTGFLAVATDDMRRPATTYRSYRWAKKLLRMPGWPDTVWTTTVYSEDSAADEDSGEKRTITCASVSVHPTVSYFIYPYTYDLCDDHPDAMLYLSLRMPGYTFHDLFDFSGMQFKRQPPLPLRTRQLYAALAAVVNDVVNDAASL